MIPLVKVNLPEKHTLLQKLGDVLYNEPINEGSRVYEFEQNLTEALECENLITVNSGTSALHLALLLSDVGGGDVVLSTSLTAEPTNTVIKSTGAQIRYVDLDASNGEMSKSQLDNTSLEKVKALIVVHYGGYVQPMDDIVNFCKEHNIKLIEDCAHAIFAKYKGKYVGSFGDFGCFSFQAIKQITTIEGGALQIKSSGLVEKAKKMRWFGLEKGIARSLNNIECQGYKYNYNNVHATIGLLQLERFDTELKRVRGIAEKYNTLIDSLKCLNRVKFDAHIEPAYWLYSLLTDDSDFVISFFEKKGIQASKLHKLNHEHEYLSTDQELDSTKEFYNKLVHIPIGDWLTDNEVEHILNTLRELDEGLWKV